MSKKKILLICIISIVCISIIGHFLSDDSDPLPSETANTTYNMTTQTVTEKNTVELTPDPTVVITKTVTAKPTATPTVKPTATPTVTPTKNNGESSRTVYRTPSGKRYHYISSCGGKNSYAVTLQQAKNSGLTPCQKCVG